MHKIYIPVILIFLVSCSTKVSYIGKSLPPTKTIEVYISESSIKRPFDYIGKGYLGFFKNPKKIQRKAEKIGREKGADAVLITDYYVPDAGGKNVTSVFRTDSIAKSAITTASTEIRPTSYNGYNILFIKYN